MANGANLGYSKRVFESVNGFRNIDRIASGDDMLLMEKIGFSRKICYLKSKSATVTTYPEPTIKAFLNQRIRWAGKTAAYTDWKIKGIMVLVYCVNTILLSAAVGAFFSEEMLHQFLLVLTGKFIIDLAFLWSVSTFFGQKKLLWWFTIIFPLHILYVFMAGWLGLFGQYKWKGRRLK